MNNKEGKKGSKREGADRRPAVCPGCRAALIRGRRARPGRFCPDCLREKVKEREGLARRHPLCGGGIEQRGEYKGYPLLVCTKCGSTWQLVGDELCAVDRQPQRPEDLGSRHVQERGTL